MDSRPIVKKETIFTLKDEVLLKSVFHDDLSRIRGKNYASKKTVLKNLTKGQMSLFMFISIYYHNQLGWQSFLDGFSSYFSDGYLEDIKNGLEYLGLNDLLQIIKQCEKVYFNCNDKVKMKKEFDFLDEQYRNIQDYSLKISVEYVQNHANEFVTFAL